MKYQFTHLNDVNTVHFDFWKAAGTCHIDGNSSLEILWWAFLKKRGIKVVFITRLCFIYPRQRDNCKNPTLAREEAAGKSQLCNAAEKKSKDRGGRDTTQDGQKYVKACFSFFSHSSYAGVT